MKCPKECLSVSQSNGLAPHNPRGRRFSPSSLLFAVFRRGMAKIRTRDGPLAGKNSPAGPLCSKFPAPSPAVPVSASDRTAPAPIPDASVTAPAPYPYAASAGLTCTCNLPPREPTRGPPRTRRLFTCTVQKSCAGQQEATAAPAADAAFGAHAAARSRSRSRLAAWSVAARQRRCRRSRVALDSLVAGKESGRGGLLASCSHTTLHSRREIKGERVRGTHTHGEWDSRSSRSIPSFQPSFLQNVKEQQEFRFYTIKVTESNSTAHRSFGRMGGFYNTGAGHILLKMNQLLTNLFLLLIYNCSKRGIQWAGHTLECA